MTHDKMKNDSHIPYLHIAARFLPFAAAVYFFSFVSADPDLWGHITFGTETWGNKALTKTDPYSFTAHREPWINHEWLAEVIFYLTYRFLGDAGLLFGKLIIGLFIVALLWKICTFQKNMPLVTAGILILAVIVISPAFMIRPQVFSLLFFTLFLFLFYLYLEKDTDRLCALPFLMALWVNLHGGFLLGWAILLAVAGWVTVLRLTSAAIGYDKVRRLWLWVIPTSLATLLNPYGYKLHLFLFNSLSFPRQISEWAPVNLFDLSFPRFKLMALLFLIMVVSRKPKGNETWQIVIVAATLAAALLHRRHMPFFGITACPYLSYRISDLVEKTGYRRKDLKLTRSSANLLALFVTLLAAYLLYGGVRPYVASGCRIIVDPAEYPVGAVHFLKSNQMHGNLLVPFDWGEYAIWHLYPDCRVSIDGRFRTVYPEAVIEDHFAAKADPAKWKRLLDSYPVDILLVHQIPFFQQMIRDKGPWVYAYSDPLSIVFLKNNANNKEVLENFRAGMRKYEKTWNFYFP